MMRTVIPLLLATATALTGSEAQRPNLLFIMVDTLRADHLQSHGYHRETMPTWDTLGAEGVRFVDCVAAAPWTIPSLTTMFTGLPPSVHGVNSFQNTLPDDAVTLAERLQGAGYATAAFVANPAANAKFGFGQGFELYDDYSVFLTGALAVPDLSNEHGADGLRTTGRLVSRLGTRWLRERVGSPQPFFLFLGYFDPHADYLPPDPHLELFADPAYRGTESGRDLHVRGHTITEPTDRQHVIDRYDGELRFTDDQIAEVLAAIDEAGLRENTLVVLVSDHGEEFWDHGGVLHGHTLHEELLAVPLAMRLPGTLPAGRNVEDQVAHVDLHPTILGLLGLELSDAVMGRDLSASLRDPTVRIPLRPAFAETEASGQDLIALRTREHKLVFDRHRQLAHAYDRVADPAEQRPLAVDDVPWGALRLAELHAWSALCRTRTLQAGETEIPVLDAATIESLRSLGYLR